MSIAILTDKLITGGGGECYVRNVIRALLKAGDAVDCFAAKVALPEELLSQPKLTIRRQNLSWRPRRLRSLNAMGSGFSSTRIREIQLTSQCHQRLGRSCFVMLSGHL